MPAIGAIERCLREAHIPHTLMYHQPVFTAQEEASVTHTPGRDWAKAVICIADDQPIQAVLPADRMVNLDQLRSVVGAHDVRLARDDELSWLFPDCERGATPPLGPIFNQPVYVDIALTAEPEVAFNAGTHTHAIRMRYIDFARFTHPIVGAFAERR